MKSNKKKIIRDFEKLSNEIKEQLKLFYQEGYTQNLIKYKDIKGNDVSALPFETEDCIYLIRMSVNKAEQLVIDDFDYDDEGFLKEEIKEIYSDKYSDNEMLTENDESENDESEDELDDDFDLNI